MGNKVVLRNSGGRILDVEMRSDGSLEIHGQDFGSEVEAIFGRDEYEWYKTIPVENLLRLRRALGMPDDGDLLSYLRDHCTADEGNRFEDVVRENSLVTTFWSSG
jgi:hypothetical protein